MSCFGRLDGRFVLTFVTVRVPTKISGLQLHTQ